jgi:hypothetical protein
VCLFFASYGSKRVSLVAADTASSLLQSADGQEAYAAKNCPSEVRTLLKPFLDVRRSSSGFMSPPSSSSANTTDRGSSSSSDFLSLSEFQSRALWAPSHRKPYGVWVCALTARLLLDCYEQPGSAATLTPPPTSKAAAQSGQSSTSRGAAVRGTASPAVRRGLVGRDDFYRHCRQMAALRPAFAELLFPAVIDDLTR